MRKEEGDFKIQSVPIRYFCSGVHKNLNDDCWSDSNHAHGHVKILYIRSVSAVQSETLFDKETLKNSLFSRRALSAPASHPHLHP